METYPSTPDPRASPPRPPRKTGWIHAKLDDPLVQRLERVCTAMDRGQYFPASSDDLGEIRHGLGQRLTWYEGRARNREIPSDFVERRDGQLMLVRQTFSRGIGRSTLIAAIAMGVMFTVGLVLAGMTGGAVVASLGFLILPRFITRNAAPRLAYTRDCPHCTYDLEGCPPGIAVEDNYGLDIGPRACPECGCPWPLIPPRTPETPAEP